MNPPHARRLMLVAENGGASHRSHSVCVRPFPLSPCLVFVYLYLVLGCLPAAVINMPSVVQINLLTNDPHVLRLFFTFVICACGMTVHNCTLTRIAMFVYFSPLNMPSGTTTFRGRRGCIGNVGCEDSELEMREV